MGGPTGDGTADDMPTAYRRLADAVDDWLFVVDASGKLSAVNDAFAQLTERSRTSLVGADVESVVEPPGGERLRQRCRSLQPAETAQLHVTLSAGDAGEGIPCSVELSADGDEIVAVCEPSTTDEPNHLERREATLRETHEVIADRERDFDEQVDALLEIGQRVTGTAYATLARIRGDDYVFESVISPADDVEPGDVVPMSTRVCERTAAREESLVFEDISAEAPELADRGDRERLDVNCYLGAPIFVDDEVRGLFCFYGPEAGADGFSEWDVTFVDLVSRWIGTELERQRRTERLAAVNELDGVVREVSDAVIDQSTREEIEATACRCLAESDSYDFALLGEVDAESRSLELRSAAGVAVPSEEWSLSAPTDGSDKSGPTEAAIRHHELRTLRDVRGDPSVESWLPMGDSDVRSVASVPVVYEGSLYGTLVVATERIEAFESEERAVLEHLGELVGHAIAAAERKRALMSDDVTELEFRASDYAPSADDGTVRFERSVPLGDDEFLVYGTVDEGAVDTLETFAASRASWTEIEVFGDGGDERSFEIELSEPPLLSSMASIGASVRQVVLEDGDLRATVRAPCGTDVRRVIDTVQETFPEAEPLARRQVTRSSSAATSSTVADELTDRQRAALEAAYYAGFFEWPREHSGESVADSLGVSPPTFHQHIRAAENKVMQAFLEDGE
jgi:PAS domain S-box-containing protein